MRDKIFKAMDASAQVIGIGSMLVFVSFILAFLFVEFKAFKSPSFYYGLGAAIAVLGFTCTAALNYGRNTKEAQVPSGLQTFFKLNFWSAIHIPGLMLIFVGALAGLFMTNYGQMNALNERQSDLFTITFFISTFLITTGGSISFLCIINKGIWFVRSSFEMWKKSLEKEA